MWALSLVILNYFLLRLRFSDAPFSHAFLLDLGADIFFHFAVSAVFLLPSLQLFAVARSGPRKSVLTNSV